MVWYQLAKLMRLVRNRLPEFISDVLGHTVINRTFPSLCLPPIQSECKCEVYFTYDWKLIFMRKTSHLDSLWRGGRHEFGNGLFWTGLADFTSGLRSFWAIEHSLLRLRLCMLHSLVQSLFSSIFQVKNLLIYQSMQLCRHLTFRS